MEELGRIAELVFLYIDRKVPLKSTKLTLLLKLFRKNKHSWSCRKTFAVTWTSFMTLGEVATGELTQLTTQHVSYFKGSVPLLEHVVGVTTLWTPDPFCCIAKGTNKPCANSIISSEFAGIFPQEVPFVVFTCRLPLFSF